MPGHGSDEPPLEILKYIKEPWEERLDKKRDEEMKAYQERLAQEEAAIAAAEGE